MTFEQLMHEHDLIDVITHRLEACCESAVPLVERAIAARDALREELEAHLSHEDEGIYPRLMYADACSVEVVGKFMADFAALRLDWSAYLNDWDAECMAVDWESFRQETTALMARVRERTQQETSLLYPLALRTGAIALRAAPSASVRGMQSADA